MEAFSAWKLGRLRLASSRPSCSSCRNGWWGRWRLGRCTGRDTTPASGQVSSGCELTTGTLSAHLGPICLPVSSAETELLDSSARAWAGRRFPHPRVASDLTFGGVRRQEPQIPGP